MTQTDLTNSGSASERVLAYCRARGVKLTPVREKVLSLLAEAGRPMKAYDLLELLKPGPGAAQPPTVYRALDFLLDAGLVHKVASLNAFMLCGHRDCDHVAALFICEVCGRAEERHADLPEPQSAPKGFVRSRSVIEHHGVCGLCATANA
ncbi:MAG: transcriptional repressor [Maricaulaceae bacterium]